MNVTLKVLRRHRPKAGVLGSPQHPHPGVSRLAPRIGGDSPERANLELWLIPWTKDDLGVEGVIYNTPQNR